MKQYSVAGKALTLAFASVLLAACAGSPQDDTTDTDAARDAEIAAQEEAAREAARRAEEEAAAAQLQLEQSAMAAGTVFYFDFDSSVLKPAAQMALDAHIALLKTNDRSVRLDGHTDERGTRDYNMALGERRANAVRDYMVVNGIASYRIETVSYGEEQPVAYGSGEANWSQNRRVELK
ncbi:MAG: peptidoglycan-associated lipoprotein Pal [Pseudomonadota bacterium]